MLKLLFKAFDNRGGVEVSAYAFTLHRGNLEAWPEGRLVARHVENQWAVDGRTFLRFECGPNVACLFESADSVAEHYGPFDSLSCVDGVVWAESDAIATLKSDHHWASMSTRKAWPKLRLAFSQAAAGPTRV